MPPKKPSVNCLVKFRNISASAGTTIKTVGFCAGSGSDFIKDTPCDAFVTGDLKYHSVVETNKVIYDIGHFESEIMSVGLLKELSGVNEKGIIAYEESPFN